MEAEKGDEVLRLATLSGRMKELMDLKKWIKKNELYPSAREIIEHCSDRVIEIYEESNVDAKPNNK